MVSRSFVLDNPPAACSAAVLTCLLTARHITDKSWGQVLQRKQALRSRITYGHRPGALQCASSPSAYPGDNLNAKLASEPKCWIFSCCCRSDGCSRSCLPGCSCAGASGNGQGRRRRRGGSQQDASRRSGHLAGYHVGWMSQVPGLFLAGTRSRHPVLLRAGVPAAQS